MSGHQVNPDPEQSMYDECLKCGKPIHADVYTGQLATMIGRNFECYGK